MYFSDKSGDILPLSSKQIKLLQLKTKDCETIVCSAISRKAKYIAYSDQETIKLYSLTLVTKFEILILMFCCLDTVK